jgi:hypothetical protein
MMNRDSSVMEEFDKRANAVIAFSAVGLFLVSVIALFEARWVLAGVVVSISVAAAIIFRRRTRQVDTSR